MKTLKTVALILLVFLPFSLKAQTPAQSFSYPVTNVEPEDIQRWNGFYYLQDTALDWNPCHHKDVNNQCVGGYGNWYLCGDVFHPGWDMNYPNETNEAVYPIADGVVYVVERDAQGNPKTPSFIPANWNAVIVKHIVGGQTFYTAYGHMAQVDVAEGQIVTANQTQLGIIGDIGATGQTHLHLEIRTFDHPSVYNSSTGQERTPNEVAQLGRINYWNCATDLDGDGSTIDSDDGGLYNFAFVSAHYYHPELFIKGYPVIGLTNNSTHIAAADFISVYDQNQVSKTGANPWDQYQYWDQAFN